MTRQRFGEITVVVMMMLLLALSPDSHAGDSRPAKKKTVASSRDGKRAVRERGDKERGRSFSISGVYTGTIGGRLTLEDKEYWIARDVPVFVLGEGLQRTGMFVVDRSVFLAGVEGKGVRMVRMVIVRPRLPAGEVLLGKDAPGEIGTIGEDHGDEAEQ